MNNALKQLIHMFGGAFILFGVIARVKIIAGTA
jgi:hypothetical protein